MLFMEIPQQKIDLKNIIALYGDRKKQSDEKLPEREELNINKGVFMKNINRAANESFQSYSQQKDQEGVTVADTEYAKTNNILLRAEVVDPSVPVTLVTILSKTVMKKTGYKGDILECKLFKGELGKEDLEQVVAGNKGNGIAYFLYPINGNVLDMRHREVDPTFRRQGFGDAMLKFSEEFLQKKATVEQEEQSVEATTNQLDVICWLWNNGFRPKEKKDQENLEKILSGDKDLQIEEGLHVGPTEESGVKSVRLKMEKKVYPGTAQELGNKKTEVRSAIDKIIPL